MEQDTRKFTNAILSSLPESEVNSVSAYLEFQELPLHTILVDPEEPLRYAYFLQSGVASLLVPTSEGRSVEVGLVGKSGFVATSFFSSIRRHTIFDCDWSSDVCSSD